MPMQEIEDLKSQLVNKLLPIKIYLFGSFANGAGDDYSDFDFYIVVSDGVKDIAAETAKAYKAIRLNATGTHKKHILQMMLL